jgi:UDP-N-acetylmuramyl pentapeptide phosphotransferase/UDP-N-acetylglucosamine-1-phosphate transferase
MHADTAITWTVLSLLAFVLTGVGIWTLRRHFAHDFLDIPNQRSSHIMPTPRGGGIVFVAAFFVATGIAAATIPEETGGASSMFEVLVLVLLPLWIVGTVDDVRGLSARARYLVQLAAASLAVLFFGPFLGFDAILGSLGTPWLALALSVVAITALINFYNFMDGLDGIVGGTSAVQLAFFALYLHQPIWWLLVAALLALALLQAPDAKAMWWAGAVTAPLLGDAVFTLLRRLFKRENVFEAHKSHIYQRLNQSGWSHGLVSTTYVALTLLIAVLVATRT